MNYTISSYILLPEQDHKATSVTASWWVKQDVHACEAERFIIRTAFKALSPQTFVAEGESSLLSSLQMGHPQVIVVDEGYEVRISRADLGIHACPWALRLNLDWLYRSRLLKPTCTALVKGKQRKNCQL